MFRSKELAALVVVLSCTLTLSAQDPVIHAQISWQGLQKEQLTKDLSRELLQFDGAYHASEDGFLPSYHKTVSLKQGMSIKSAEIVPIKTESFDGNLPKEISESLTNAFQLRFSSGKARNQWLGGITVVPVRKNPVSGDVELLTEFDVTYTLSKEKPQLLTRNKSFKTTSYLANESWYKFGVTEDKVYKISYNFLKSLGIDVDNIDPSKIRIFGSGGGMLPELNSDPRVDDIEENAIEVVAGSNGKFDPQDYILFYGRGPNTWAYNVASQRYEHTNHRYSDTSYYFINVDGNFVTNPKRIATVNSSTSSATHTVSAFDDYKVYEKDNINLLKSGREWYGEQFDVITSYDFTFNFPNVDVASPISLKLRGVARSGAAGNNEFHVTVNSSTVFASMGNVNTSCYYCPFAKPTSLTNLFNITQDVFTVNVTYGPNGNKPTPSAKAWLDYIEINARRKPVMEGSQMRISDRTTVGVGYITDVNVTNTNSGTRIWEITDPYNVQEFQKSFAGGTSSIRVPMDSLRAFVVWDAYDSTGLKAVGLVANQNLHGTPQKDLIIVAHPKFLSAANKLAIFHEAEGLSTVVATPGQIYNEFSSGAKDIVAIRDFVRMFYERASGPSDQPRYLLLIGDGSYDNKNRISGNTSYIPTYQSGNSLDPTSSYVSDDYFGMLDPSEGKWNGTEFVDIGLGRLPVKSLEEADGIVAKIQNYSQPAAMRDWRNRVVFFGDDEDGNLHMLQSNNLATMVDTGFQDFNVDKVMFDAYQQESTPGGQRYPDVHKLINDRVNAGALIINYTGHGGEVGWAHETVLGISDINDWTNSNSLPLFVTATCEFSRFDDPARTSAGELVMLNPDGGGVGLLTTVRLAFSSDNYNLNRSFYSHVFKKPGGQYQRLGDIFMTVKNENMTSSNTRNFTLLGDPALMLAYPEYDIVTTEINGNTAAAGDTIGALSKVTIKGYVADNGGTKLNNFNGVIYPTVFDKYKQISTLNNDNVGVFNFNVQNSKLFKGKASVSNGDFEFSFIVPKDIAYNYGAGRLSYYAQNQVDDANGYYEGFTVGGTAPSYANDNTGPTIELYMNDRSFVYGGMTDENPLLLAFVSDEHGINMVGNGIGHDIIAILDGKTDEAIVLNDFYEADLDSYQSGVINYPFSDLAEGVHTLTLKVWDVYNNSAEATIEFVVVKNEDIVIDRVFNYPNPFTTRTEFWFEHNQPGQTITAQVQIFTVSGKLIKTIEQNINTPGYRSSEIVWNGRDDYGDKIGKGVYMYKLTVRGSNGSFAEKYEKLVIL